MLPRNPWLCTRALGTDSVGGNGGQSHPGSDAFDMWRSKHSRTENKRNCLVPTHLVCRMAGADQKNHPTAKPGP